MEFNAKASLCRGSEIPTLCTVVQEGDAAEAWYGRPAESWAEGERLLACGASAVADLRAAVQSELGFSCSAGAVSRPAGLFLPPCSMKPLYRA